MRRTVAKRLLGINTGGPRNGWERLRYETHQLREFLFDSQSSGNGSNHTSSKRTNTTRFEAVPGESDNNDDGRELRSFYFANFLGPHDFNWETLTVSAGGRKRLKKALAAREAVIGALDMTDFEMEKRAAISGAGLRYVRYGNVPPWLIEPRYILDMKKKARNPNHPFFNPDARKYYSPGVGTSLFSKLVQWSLEPVFHEPDFSDGLATAFYAVMNRSTATLTAETSIDTADQKTAHCNGFELDPELKDMLHPKLFNSLHDAISGQVCDSFELNAFV